MGPRVARRRKPKRKLEPSLPETMDELNLPKYFGVIHGSGRQEEQRREEMPLGMEGVSEVPKAIRGSLKLPLDVRPPNPAPEVERVPLILRILKRSTPKLDIEPERPEGVPNGMPEISGMPRAIISGPTLPSKLQLPDPAPEIVKVPLIIRIMKRLVPGLSVEPDRPLRMPTVPKLDYPALYTRYPIMKTVTKTTDAFGKIQVDFAQTFQEVPGVVMTIQGEESWSGNVFDVSTTFFRAIFFKAAHNHGGTVDNNGRHDHDGAVAGGGIHNHGGTVDNNGRHTPYINADGNHTHNVHGTGHLSLDTNYGRLVMSNYTNYETAHVHTQVQTQLETDHTHGLYPTSYESGHTHSNPNTGLNGGHSHSVGNTGAPSGWVTVMDYTVSWGSVCTAGACVSQFYGQYAADAYHSHSNPGTSYIGSHIHSVGSTGTGSQHRHTMPDTQTGSDHRHLLNNTGAAPSPGHRHLISDSALYNHYVYDVGLTLDLVASSYESPYHAHSAEEIVAHDHVVDEELAHDHSVTEQADHDHVVDEELAHDHSVTEQADHDHVVASDGGSVLKNTSVTITYIAQVES